MTDWVGSAGFVRNEVTVPGLPVRNEVTVPGLPPGLPVPGLPLIIWCEPRYK
jgi:hypothetical protein